MISPMTSPHLSDLFLLLDQRLLIPLLEKREDPRVDLHVSLLPGHLQRGLWQGGLLLLQTGDTLSDFTGLSCQGLEPGTQRLPKALPDVGNLGIYLFHFGMRGVKTKEKIVPLELEVGEGGIELGKGRIGGISDGVDGAGHRLSLFEEF
jgi:hypothetical protein